MRRVLKLGKAVSCLLLALAGCSTAPRGNLNPRPLNWSATEGQGAMTEESERVPEEPHLAPPPVSVPALSPRQGTFSAETWISLERWAREHHIGALRRISLAPLPTYALTTPDGELVFQTHSLVAKWNGVELHLGFEPQWVNGRPFVQILDLKKNIEPLLQGWTPPPENDRVIVIDPGHGGQNTGTKSVVDGVYEKEYTLDWAERLGTLLATNGWQVFLTRTADVDMELSNRVEFTEEHQAALFLSLHFNSAAPSQEQSGLETYCLTPTGMPSTLTRGYEDDPSLVFPNNAYDAQNLQLAMHLQRALLQVVGTDRGVRRARFLGVLRGQHCPAVLIEGGYLSNPREARLIAEPAYRQKLAEAIAQALE